jgi:hypothetical protein
MENELECEAQSNSTLRRSVNLVCHNPISKDEIQEIAFTLTRTSYHNVDIVIHLVASSMVYLLAKKQGWLPT